MFFFFNDTATTEIYTLSLHDALPISIPSPSPAASTCPRNRFRTGISRNQTGLEIPRSEEHTSELQSQSNLVCRLLLEKKNTSLTYSRVLCAVTLAPCVSPRPAAQPIH